VSIGMRMMADRPRWRTAAAAFALAPAVALSLSGAATVPAHVAASGQSWLGNWMGTASTVPSTTLANVRAIIGANTGQAAALTGAGVGIALIDTGVAPVEGITASQVVNGPDLSFESQSTYLRYLDTFGHGTHMAGIMIGNGNYTGNVGIAPKAMLTSIKVGVASGAVDVSQVIAAIDWVVQHKNDDPANPIRVINLSYGSGGVPSIYNDPLMAAAEHAIKAGIVVVAAAGNESRAKLSDPALDPFAFSVGSIATKGTVNTADDTTSTFNNGKTSGTTTFAFVAPGEGIVSLRDPGSNIDLNYPQARQGEYQFRGSGSSQASAIASAAVALLLQARPTLTPDEAFQVMKASAGVVDGTRKLINVDRAVSLAVPTYTPRVVWSDGTGLLEYTRGTTTAVSGTTSLKGQNSIFGPFNAADWAARSTAHTAWSGGVWMDKRFAGDAWTGTSWASRTWASATWSGTTWSGQSWVDPMWSGRTWSGRTWSGRTWSCTAWQGQYWTGEGWG
jgi:serine protease AprX